jgi:hypothetical protein
LGLGAATEGGPQMGRLSVKGGQGEKVAMLATFGQSPFVKVLILLSIFEQFEGGQGGQPLSLGGAKVATLIARSPVYLGECAVMAGNTAS